MSGGRAFTGLTKHQKRALFWIVGWDSAYGGLCSADGRSVQELIKRRWVVPCICVEKGFTGIMTAEMKYVITANGRQAAVELGWKPDADWLSQV